MAQPLSFTSNAALRWSLVFVEVARVALPSPASASAHLEPIAAITAATSDNRERALRCLTYAVAYEAGHESLEGQRAVATVVLNRTAHPAYPKSVCGVVFQGAARQTGCQFTFTCDGALNRRLSPLILASARAVAEQVIDGYPATAIGGATHYHASYVSPYWAPTLYRVGRIGLNIFYRAPGAASVAAHWSGQVEPDVSGLGSWLKAGDALTARVPGRLPMAPGDRPFSPWGLALHEAARPIPNGSPE